MANFKFVISEPESKKSYQLEVDQSKAAGIVGKKIGEDFDADVIGLSGYVLKITGGTDRDGFPMHPKQEGSGKRRVLLTGTPGFYPKIKGQRKRKTIRGNTISEDIAQINTKVVKKGAKTLDEITGKKLPEQAKPAEEKKEEPAPKQEAKTETKKEEVKAEPEKKEEEVKTEMKEEAGQEQPKQEVKAEEKKE